MREDGIRVEEVGRVIAELTRSLEAEGGAVSAMVQTQNRFEHWWKFSLLHRFTLSPWERQPGYSIGDGAGVAVESVWDVADRRRAFTRRTGREQKRVDLIVRAGQLGYRSHLIEMKLIDGRSGKRAQDIANFQRDIEALRAVVGWEDVASCWAVALAYSFEGPEDLTEALESNLDEEHVAAIRRWPIARVQGASARLWVLGARVG